jgi:ribosomal protein S18 acetylase RimI-like enzyme
MRFELDKILTDEILFYMENQNGEFLLDTHKAQVIDINNNELEGEPNYNDEERFIPLPEWSSNDGYRLMERFTAGLKNPIARHELSLALNKNRGVFRYFKNVIDQYPEIEKLWFAYKESEMKREVLAWYNALRVEWGLEPIGSEPEDTSSLVLEDFILREGNEGDAEKIKALHELCVKELEEKGICAIFESMNPFDLSVSDLSGSDSSDGGFSLVAESADGDFSGFIRAVKDSPSLLRICALEVKSEYLSLGLGKALLSKLLEKADAQKFTVTIDLPSGTEYFARSLHIEDFKPCVQRFVRRQSE